MVHWTVWIWMGASAVVLQENKSGKKTECLSSEWEGLGLSGFCLIWSVWAASCGMHQLGIPHLVVLDVVLSSISLPGHVNSWADQILYARLCFNLCRPVLG